MYQIFSLTLITLSLGLFAGKAQAQERTSRTLVDDTSSARDLVLLLDPETPISGNEVSVFLPVEFAFDSFQLTSTSVANLIKVAEALTAPEFEGTVFTLEGHTDASGPASYNMRLSLSRARAVAEFLVSAGVGAAQLKVVGRGEADLLPQFGPYARQQRRVEIVRSF